jgi:hypothetical protein
MNWFNKNKETSLHVHYECEKTHGNVTMKITNFKWTDEIIQKIKAYISKEYCNDRTVLIANVIKLKDER